MLVDKGQQRSYDKLVKQGYLDKMALNDSRDMYRLTPRAYRMFEAGNKLGHKE